jgi:hypothetical protein
MKRFGLHFALCGLCAYAAFGLIGLAAPPTLGIPLSARETQTSLAFSFPDEGGDWTRASGYASHGWLYRRAYVQGMSAAGARRAEQVLKVGWPFTVVRGFVRSGNGAPGHLGVGWTSDVSPGDPARLLPLQPVWPGIVLYGVLGALMLAAWDLRSARKAAALSA